MIIPIYNRQKSCKFHQEQKYFSYCLECDCLVCKSCILGVHKEHKCKDLEKAEDFEFIFNQYNQLSQDMPTYDSYQKKIVSLQEEIGSLLNSYESCKTAISDQFTDLRVLLNNRESQMLKELQDKFNEKKLFIQEKLKYLDSLEQCYIPIKLDSTTVSSGNIECDSDSSSSSLTTSTAASAKNSSTLNTTSSSSSSSSSTTTTTTITLATSQPQDQDQQYIENNSNNNNSVNLPNNSNNNNNSNNSNNNTSLNTTTSTTTITSTTVDDSIINSIFKDISKLPKQEKQVIFDDNDYFVEVCERNSSMNKYKLKSSFIEQSLSCVLLTNFENINIEKYGTIFSTDNLSDNGFFIYKLLSKNNCNNNSNSSNYNSSNNKFNNNKKQLVQKQQNKQIINNNNNCNNNQHSDNNVEYKIEMLNLTDMKWRNIQIGNLSNRRGTWVQVANKYIYSFGNNDSQELSSKYLYRFCFATNSWENMGLLPADMDNTSTPVYDGFKTIYIFGGRSRIKNGVLVKEIRTYDTSNNTYTVIDSYDQPLSNLLAVYDGTKMVYLFGGEIVNNNDNKASTSTSSTSSTTSLNYNVYTFNTSIYKYGYCTGLFNSFSLSESDGRILAVRNDRKNNHIYILSTKSFKRFSITSNRMKTLPYPSMFTMDECKDKPFKLLFDYGHKLFLFGWNFGAFYNTQNNSWYTLPFNSNHRDFILENAIITHSNLPNSYSQLFQNLLNQSIKQDSQNQDDDQQQKEIVEVINVLKQDIKEPPNSNKLNSNNSSSNKLIGNNNNNNIPVITISEKSNSCGSSSNNSSPSNSNNNINNNINNKNIQQQQDMKKKSNSSITPSESCEFSNDEESDSGDNSVPLTSSAYYIEKKLLEYQAKIKPLEKTEQDIKKMIELCDTPLDESMDMKIKILNDRRTRKKALEYQLSKLYERKKAIEISFNNNSNNNNDQIK